MTVESGSSRHSSWEGEELNRMLVGKVEKTRRLQLVAVVCVLSILLAACSGYAPARIATKSAAKTQTETGPAPDPATTAPELPTEPGQGPAITGGPAKAGQSQPRKVLTKTSSGITVSQTAGGLPKADIWPAAEDKVGYTATEIKLCMHAAFALGHVFDNRPDDEKVYWDEVNRTGGVFGRKVLIKYEDDAYLPDTTTAALNRCKDGNPFLYLGGVGFDQAPAARTWAEANKMPYFYNMAAEASNLKYSFSPIASIQRNGGFLGQFAATRLAGKKFGIIYVNTDNWRVGSQRFEDELKARGITVAEGDKKPIQNNNHADFLTIINQFQQSGVTALLTYINALALNRFIAQADGQQYHPVILSPDGFDLVPDTVGNGRLGDGVDHMRNFPGIYAGWVSPAYETGPPAEKARTSVSWYSEMEKMKAAYVRHLPEKKVNDVDWMFWLYAKTIHQMLLDCTADCSRNVLAGLMLTGYKTTAVLDCPVDFSLGGGRLGGHYLNMYKSESVGLPGASKSYWRQIETCKSGF